MKKAILGGILVLALASTFAIQSASAKNNNGNAFGWRIKEKMNELRGELKINAKNGLAWGHVKFIGHPVFERPAFKGKVISISGGNTLVIESKKDTEWTVNVESTDIIANRDWDKINFSDIQIGHDVMIMGSLSRNNIDAKIVRDLSVPPVQNRTLTGIVNATSSTGFKMTAGSKEYTVAVDANDILVNRVWDSITLADVKTEDRVSVFGSINNTTLSMDAKLVRNLSLPFTKIEVLNGIELESEED